MKFNIEYVVGSSGTLMAKTFYGDDCIVEDGPTFEEAEKKLIRSLKKRMLIITPKPKEIEINLCPPKNKPSKFSS